MFTRTILGAVPTSRLLLARSARGLGRSLHQASSTAAPASGKAAGWVAGAAVAVGVSGWTLATQSRLRMEDKPVADSPLEATELSSFQQKSATIAEVVVETDGEAPAATTDAETQAKEGEEEDPGSAAFDPVTGEINWDCPCLGGMAHGPCGPEFREAFSCFVYSEKEPKGIDCVEKFKGMQDCFRAHPEVYGEEIDDDESSATEQLSDAPLPEDLPEPEPEKPTRKWRSRYED